MQIETAIHEYLTALKEAAPRAQVEAELAVLARVQEYLEGDPALASAEAIRSADLLGFIRSWLREDEGVNPAAARRLMGALVGWAGWLDRHRAGPEAFETKPDVSAARWVEAQLTPLAESLPRAIQVAELLRRHARRKDLSEAIPVEEASGGSPLGTISAGVTRVMRPVEIDYGRAEEDAYRIVGVENGSLTLHSPAREQLGEGAAAPVIVPPRIANLLRVGDILHAEIAPTVTGWEILNVEALLPGELNDRP